METSRKQTTDFEVKIIKQLEALPVTRSLFTKFEDDMVRKYYPSRGAKISKPLGKTPTQIRRRAKRLGVRYESAS